MLPRFTLKQLWISFQKFISLKKIIWVELCYKQHQKDKEYIVPDSMPVQ